MQGLFLCEFSISSNFLYRTLGYSASILETVASCGLRFWGCFGVQGATGRNLTLRNTQLATRNFATPVALRYVEVYPQTSACFKQNAKAFSVFLHSSFLKVLIEYITTILEVRS